MSLLKSQIVSGTSRARSTPVRPARPGHQDHRRRPSPGGRLRARRPAGHGRRGPARAAPLEKRTGYLAMLGNLATLAGLLGTITGLIKSFAGVAGVDPSMKATMLSKGISEAMNCTAFGLVTGIFGLAAYAGSTARPRRVLDGINQATVETLNLVVAGRERWHSSSSTERPPPPQPERQELDHECFSRHWRQKRKEVRQCRPQPGSIHRPADVHGGVPPHHRRLVPAGAPRGAPEGPGPGRRGHAAEKVFKLVVVVNSEGSIWSPTRISSRSPRGATTTTSRSSAAS